MSVATKDDLIEENLTSLEKDVINYFENLPCSTDGRWGSIAKTDIERGFMAIRRAINNG